MRDWPQPPFRRLRPFLVVRRITPRRPRLLGGRSLEVRRRYNMRGKNGLRDAVLTEQKEFTATKTLPKMLKKALFALLSTFSPILRCDGTLCIF